MIIIGTIKQQWKYWMQNQTGEMVHLHPLQAAMRKKTENQLGAASQVLNKEKQNKKQSKIKILTMLLDDEPFLIP